MTPTPHQGDGTLLTDDHLKTSAELLGADLIAADQARTDPGRRRVDYKVKRARVAIALTKLVGRWLATILRPVQTHIQPMSVPGRIGKDPFRRDGTVAYDVLKPGAKGLVAHLIAPHQPSRGRATDIGIRLKRPRAGKAASLAEIVGHRLPAILAPAHAPIEPFIKESRLVK